MSTPAPDSGLAPYATLPETSRGRLYPEAESPIRSPFQRDRDRVLHATAFRRMKHKTQVFVAHEGDHYRTRLTHSLEVAQIARTICRTLRLNEDLVEALALAHDLGHTPFGHAGEDALNTAMAPYGGFDHNAQTLRILTRLERRYAEFDGLNLTWETLEGVVKHNGPLTGPLSGGKPVALPILEYVQVHDLELGTFPGIEAQVAALSDDIAYNNHDIDDGLRAELFQVDDLADIPLVGDMMRTVAARYPDIEKTRLIHETVRRLIDHMVNDLLAETRRRLEAAGPADVGAVRALDHAVVAFSEKMRAADASLRAFLHEHMYRHEKVNRMTNRARGIVTDLFTLMLANPDVLPYEWRRRADAPKSPRTARLVADYIAGMTDSFALDEHRRLFDTAGRSDDMNLYRYFDQEIAKALAALADEGALPAGLDLARVTVEPTRDPAHGDISSNAAMVLAKPAGKKPRDIAQALVQKLGGHAAIASAEVAGPGFVNMRLAESFWHARMADILEEALEYGASDMGKGVKVNVEYVSANPTGPMHVGHGRGAVVGDALAAVLEKAGYSVTREYYINDAGAQVDALARSAHLRYREALGDKIGAIPEGLYPGDYLVPVGQALAKQFGERWRKALEAEWLEPVRTFTIDAMLALIREDLKALGVTHKLFTSERALAKAGQVDAALKFLADRDLVYTGVLEPPKGMKPDDWEERPQTLFRATRFGDDVDRPLKKSDGSWTYFATDIAYHLDKFRRGFAVMIDVWGADHGGYVKRMQAAVQAITEGKGALDVKLCQLVNLLDKGEPVKMSKRAGTFITLREVVDEVGKDVFRFIMLTRKNDATLDFDYAKVMEKTRENPVFYVQYAHARCHSVFRNAAEAFPGLDMTPEALAAAPLARLADPAELALIKRLAGWPRLVESAAETHEPHRLAFYLYDVASEFHALWNKGNEDAGLRFIVESDRELTRARLAMVRAVQLLIASGLAIIGVTPVEELR